MKKETIFQSSITCPKCKGVKIETMPTDACQWFYECKYCGELLKPKQGDCCVFCSYGSVPCPSIQKEVLSMETPICSACGCSLVRLGITQEKAVSHNYQEKQYWFCCDGCLELFKNNPEQLLNETSELVVCPVCLAEKSVTTTVEHIVNGMLYNFCRCPYCLSVFNQDQDYFIKRLAWKTNYIGIFGEKNGCCSKHN